jgi:hypothetical protein
VSRAPLVLRPAPPDAPGVRYVRGTKRPRAIAWFGFSSFWGHLRHLVASAIATENIDSRQWMIPNGPDDLLARVIGVLVPRGAKAGPEVKTLSDALGRDAWIDFVADTGDDVTVSRAVARLVAGTYEVDGVVLPRGDVLALGGDLAYPVATVREITRRLVEPWNEVFEELAVDTKPRVLLAIPGNHDWYDGLDGFARLCQAPCAFEGDQTDDDVHHPNTEQHPVLAWAEAFSRGEAVKKPGAIALFGYVPVQRASYFRMPLAPNLDLFAVDRQLRKIDPRQEAFFRVPTAARTRLVLMPDPVRAWGEHRPNGAAALAAIGMNPTKTPSLILAGDVHHYERSREGPSVHVVSGGGGAFLHGARVAGKPAYTIEREFPGPQASWSLLRNLPWHVASGGAGWVITAVFALAHAIALFAYFHRGAMAAATVAACTSAIIALGTALLVGWRRHSMLRVVPLTAFTGLVIGALPFALGVAADRIAVDVLRGASVDGWPAARALALVVAWGLATWTSGFAFGAMLALIARLGLNHAQPYAALGVPAYKQFVRMRVSRAGRIDAFVIGVVDPVGALADPATDSGAVLVDRFDFP